MPAASPRVRILAACDTWGRTDVIRRCERVLAGDLGDMDLLLVLGGAAARRLVGGGIPSGQEHWPRVWAARGLLWAGPGSSGGALRRALRDDSWRVREMACKVVARHVVDDLLDDVQALETDPVERVRVAARRAARCIVTSTG